MDKTLTDCICVKLKLKETMKKLPSPPRIMRVSATVKKNNIS